MIPDPIHRGLLGIGVVLALVGAAFGHGPPARAAPALSSRAPATVPPFDVARALSESPPDLVVITLDAPRHALRYAVPSSLYGRTDDELVARAPPSVRLILAGSDPVRVDRVARKLLAAGRSVRVLEGGLAAWDRVMDSDPTAPPATASVEVWARYRMDAALRRSFGDAPPSAPVTVRAVAPPPTAPASGGTGRREGC